MNTIAIQRIAWKEFRQQRMIFIAMAIITFLMSVLVITVFRGVAGSEQWPMMTTGIFAALFSAACGGTLYATEKEEGTFLNLQLLPITGRTLMIGKVGTAYTIAFAFFIMCLLFVWLSGSASNLPNLSAGSFGSAMGLREFFLHFGLMVTEFFAWTLLFSLILSRPLVASIIGIVLASAEIQVVARLTGGFLYEPYQLEAYLPTIGPRAVFAFLILAVDAYLATRWLQVRRTDRRRRISLDRVEPGQTQRTTYRAWTWVSSLQPRVIGRFVWQANRTSWPYMMAYILLVPIAVFGGLLTYSAGAFCVIGAITGSLAFTSDKTGNRAAFLANHGERPGAYWFGHSVSWFAWIVVVNISFLALFLIFSAFNGALTKQTAFPFLLTVFDAQPAQGIVQQMGGAGTYIFASIWWTAAALFGFVAGQLCSLLIEKRILATLEAVLVSVPFGIWLMLIYASDTPLWWTVLPLFAALMFAGFLATKWWLGNRKSVLRVSGLALFVVAGWGVISGAVMWQRVNEIPAMPFDFAVLRPVATEDDVQVVKEIRVRLASAFGEFQGIDQLLFPEVEEIMQRTLEARRLNQQPLDYAELLDEDENLFASWEVFAERNPSQTIEGQMATVQALVSDSHEQLNRLQDELQFAIDNISSVQNMPPWPQVENPATPTAVAAPIEHYLGTNFELMRLSFYQAALDKDSHETWLALKRLLWINTLYSQTYGHESGREGFVAMFNTWLSLGVPDPTDLREALACSQQDWFLFTDPLRVGEALYLAAKASAGSHTYLGPSLQEELLQIVYDWVPSERIRANQIIDLVFAYGGSSLAFHRLPKENQQDSWRTEWNELLGDDHRSRFQHWVDTTLLRDDHGNNGRFSLSVYSKYYSPRTRWNSSDLDERYQCEVLVLKLGAMVWQLDHGSMPANPEDLTELVGKRRPASVRYPTLVDDGWYKEYFFVSDEYSGEIEICLDDVRLQAYLPPLRLDFVRVPKIAKSRDN